jgi:GH15 family glucan-1,4-alpha-glucosidase
MNIERHQNLDLGVVGNCEVSALIDRQGRVVWMCLPRPDGDPIFSALLARRNPLGLLSEDIDPATGSLWGNYPQTYSLVGIINSALRLSRTWEESL